MPGLPQCNVPLCPNFAEYGRRYCKMHLAGAEPDTALSLIADDEGQLLPGFMLTPAQEAGREAIRAYCESVTMRCNPFLSEQAWALKSGDDVFYSDGTQRDYGDENDGV